MIDYAEKLSKEQMIICESEENLLVKACPGSGKTRTITYKLAYRIEKNPDNIKRLIAITYTNRAADEINQRIEELGIDTERVWAGTIHQFCLEWILKRYKMYTQSLNQGFKVIDERVKERYLTEIIKRLNGKIYWKEINTRYDRELHLIEQDVNKRKIISVYHQILKNNKELDFEQILVTAYNILKQNSFIASDIKDAIELICIDEYQDTQDLQYAIIEEIANSNIRKGLQINFFGDPNQAIYGNLGGMAKDLQTINSEFENIVFEEKTLSGCYRSTKRIIRFYREFMVDNYLIDAKGKHKNDIGIIKYNYTIDKEQIYDYIAQIIKNNIQDGIPENEICVLAPVWDLLYPFSKELQNRLPEVRFDAPDITPIKRDQMNVFYKLTKLLLTEPNAKKISSRRRLANEIISEISNYVGKQINIEDMALLDIILQAKESKEKGSEFVKCGIDNILDALQCKLADYVDLTKMYDDFFEKMNYRLENKEYRLTNDLATFKKMFREKEGVVINTCHGVKGEEYQTVIAFGLVYSKVPSIYIESTKQGEETNKLLYVIASRAKSRLYLFSEKGRTYWDRGIKEHVEAFPTRQLFQNKSVEYDENF